MNEMIIKWMSEDKNFVKWNGYSDSIGWYACVPMTVLASSLGLSVLELEDAIRYNSKEE